MGSRPVKVAVAIGAAVMLLGPATVGRATTEVKPYLTAVTDAYEVTPLFSVADSVPLQGSETDQYQMVGIPDGLGAFKRGNTRTLFMNHELNSAVESEPIVGGTLNRGAFVSKWILDQDGNPVAGRRAYDTVFNEDTLVGPAAQTDNTTPAFGRFCAGSMAGIAQGFRKRMYLTNEETDPPGAFSPLGSSSVAIFDNEVHVLPKLGHFDKENSVVMRGTRRKTVILSLEDGTSALDSQLYMYVGTKSFARDATVLERNGLSNGSLYVFASTTPGLNDELTFQTGSITGTWIEIPDAENLDDVALETAVQEAGAFDFLRTEDGAFAKTTNDDFFFVSTGGNADNGDSLGRLWQMHFDTDVPTGAVTLTIVYNADQLIASGGDIAISPDNIAVSRDYLMVLEGGTGDATQQLKIFERDLSVWRFGLSVVDGRTTVDMSSAVRIAELFPPGRDGIEVKLGKWEPTGIIDTTDLYGDDTWLINVQAHPPTTAPTPTTVQDGQLLLMRGTQLP